MCSKNVLVRAAAVVVVAAIWDSFWLFLTNKNEHINK